MKSSVPMGTNRMHETGMRKDRRDSHVRTLPGSVLGRRPLRLLLSLGLALLLVGPGLLSSPTPNDPGPRTDTQGGLDPGTLSGGVLQDEHRASARLGAFVDVLASPDPIPIMPEGVTDINFTFTEMNKVGAVIRSFEWRLSTLDGTTIKDAYATRICSVDLDALGTTSWTTTIDVDPDVYREMMLQGRDRLKVHFTFSGSDLMGNRLVLTKTLPVHLGQRVAMLIDEDVYPFIQDNLTRYEADANIRGYVEFVERTGRWTSPESVRQLLKTLWREEDITGAILWGYLPFAMWDMVHTDGKHEIVPIPVFYEDLDGDFIDVDRDGLYDKHIWGENDGCEIWAAFVMPPRETVPEENLDPRGQGTGGGLLGTYYNTRNFNNLRLTQVDPTIDNYWTRDTPEAVTNDDFSVKWTGRVHTGVSETYTFALHHGGGGRLWIDGNVVHDRWNGITWNMSEWPTEVYLDKGWHDIRIEYNNNNWGFKGGMRLLWTSDSILAATVNDWLDKSHAYHNGKLEYNKRALLFMDNAYGVQCRMKDPILDKHITPLYGDNVMVAGCTNVTNADDYIEALDKGHELVSVWSHAGSSSHHISYPDRPNEVNPTAASYMIRDTQAGLVTLIWGCHSGDFGDKGPGTSLLSDNLAANYAFSTPNGLAGAGTTRSYGSTYSNVYWAWQNGSSLATGWFAYLDRGYDKALRERQWPAGGTDRWIEDVVLFGDPFIRIDHRPWNLTVEINDGSEITSENNVTLHLSAIDAGAMRFKNNGGEWSDWELYCSTKEWNLAPGLGGKRVELQVRNPWGQGYFSASDVITRVGTYAASVKLAIDGGATLTNSTGVTLAMDIGEADPAQLRASYRNGDGEWSHWEPLTRTRAWTLPALNGEWTVHARVEEKAGLWRTSTNASITLDTRAPKSLATLKGEFGGFDWYISEVTVDLAASDGLTGVVSTTFRVDRGQWQDLDGAIVVDVDGEHIVDFHSRDAAGNTEDIHSVGFRIDNTPPSDLSVTIGDGGTYTNVPMARLSLTADDDGSGVSMMRLSSDGSEWGPWVPWKGWMDHLLSLEDGEVAVHYQVVDVAGNIAEPVVASILLDTTVPRADEVSPGDGATDVPVDAVIEVTFSEPVVRSSLDETTFILRNEDGTQVMGSLVYDENLMMATFDPEVDLSYFRTYTLTLGAGITDLAGNVLWGGSVLKWRFTTLGLPPGPPGSLATEISDGAQLSWVTPDDEGSGPVKGYNVYRMEMGEKGTPEFVLLVWTQDTHYFDNTLEMNIQYHYKVTASNDVGEGSPSGVASIILVPLEPDPVDTTEDPEEGPDGPPLDRDGNDAIDVESGFGGFLLPLVAVVAALAVSVAILNRRKR